MIKLYKIKPFEWVYSANTEALALVGSPYSIFQASKLVDGKYTAIEWWELMHDESDRSALSCNNLSELKAHAEQLWNERLIAALEEVKP